MRPVCDGGPVGSPPVRELPGCPPLEGIRTPRPVLRGTAWGARELRGGCGRQPSAVPAGPICRLIHNGIQVLLVTPAHRCLPPKDGPTPPADEVPSGNCACLSIWPWFPFEEPGCRGHSADSLARGSRALAVMGRQAA